LRRNNARRLAILSWQACTGHRGVRDVIRAYTYVVDIIWSTCHIIRVSWVVEIGDEFRPEFFALQENVQTERK